MSDWPTVVNSETALTEDGRATIDYPRQLMVRDDRWDGFVAELENDVSVESLVELFRNQDL